jgi:hypothetical protein
VVIEARLPGAAAVTVYAVSAERDEDRVAQTDRAS